MHSLFSWALPLVLAGGAIANPMLQRNDACLAAVTGQAALGDAALRKSHCSSFIKTIVTPSASTVTVTVTNAPSPQNNGWNGGWKRDVTVCPNEVPNYASACNSAAYKSACSVWGVKGDTTFTIPATTTTKTVYLGNGSPSGGIGGFGGPAGTCTSTKTNVITATTTVSACSGGTTTKTSTVTATTTSVSTAVSTKTVGNAPQITFTTTTTTSVGTVTSTVTSTTTSVVGAGSIGTSTVTSTTTASLTTTATSTTTTTVGASTTATVTTTVALATTTTMTTTATTTVTDPAVTTTMTLAVTANNTITMTTTVAADAVTTTMTTTVTAGGTTGATTGTPSTPSTGNCLNAAQAQTFVDAFKDLLEYTSYNGTSAPPGRGYHYNVSATYLASDFQDFSDSINWMAGYNLGQVTFPNRDAFDYGQGLLQPELTMTTLNVDFGCKTVHWRWSALTSSYAHVTGVNYFTITDDLTQIQTNFAEFNNANWIQSFAAYNPAISCVVPGGLTAAQKRSTLPRSY